MTHGKPVAISARPRTDSPSAEATKSDHAQEQTVGPQFSTNPTGGTMTRDELLKIASLAQRQSVVITTRFTRNSL
jgi:aspartate/methionine/tyrosine aminotransferase